ncbi:MAG: glycosyltransferase, partial [Chthoniobacterales bacterium]
MGEASASQLQIWQHGLPSLVTDIGWYATLPNDIVARVRRQHEIEDIREHLRRFLENPAPYHEIGRNGLRYVSEHHTVEAYVDALFQLLAAIPPDRTRTAVPWLSERAGQAMQPWFTEETASVSLPGVTRAISEVFDRRPA